MSKVLEVREFDNITCNEEYQLHPRYQYLNPKAFKELENFILTSNENDQTEALDFLKISVHRHVGKVIQAKNYVGVIQMKNGFQIQILPKVYSGNMEDSKKTFVKMLRSMKDFPSKVFNESHLKMDKMNLFEIFIHMYLQEVHHLVKHGIRSDYVPVEDNLHYYKGKLNVNKQISKNLAHKERFYVSYDEFNLNRAENKLIKSTLLKLQKLSTSSANHKGIRQLLYHFEMIEPSTNYIRDFSRVVINRHTKEYERPIEWAKVFLMNKSFTTFSGNTTARALLFPMEKVFEAYVAQKLKQALADLHWDISTQDKGLYLFNQPRQFALRPDVVITREDHRTIILDTKWKVLKKQPRQNFGISQADMYQMYAYSKKYDTPEIWLLYPLTDDMDSAVISFKSIKDEGVETHIRLLFVDISNIEESLKVLREKLVSKE